MNYLKYVEYNAENLQFYLWYRDYCKRFSELPALQKVLAPEWTGLHPQIRQNKSAQSVTIVSEKLDSVGFPKTEMAELGISDDFSRLSSPTLPKSPSSCSFSSNEKSMIRQVDFDRRVEKALAEIGVGKKPCKLCIVRVFAWLF